MSDFTDYLQRRVATSHAFLDGDPQPLFDISTTADPASIFPPSGAVVTGVDAVNGGNAVGSARFAGYDRNDFEEVDSGFDDDLAYWIGVQRSLVRVEGQDDPVPFDLRLTELFRREGGEWKLFHRHADPLKD